MTQSKHIALAVANSGRPKMVPPRAKTGLISPVLATALIDLFRVDVTSKVAKLLTVSKKQATRRLSGERKFSADELALMIRSDDGFPVLAAVMAGSRAKWWQLCEPLMEVAEVQRIQAMARRRLRKAVQGALDADRDLAATIAAADVLSDQEFVRPHVDALRATGGVPNRTVAQATKGKR